MKAEDVISQLMLRIPAKTNLFTDEFEISSMTRSGTEVTVVTKQEHGLESSDLVHILGSDVTIGGSITRSGTVATMVLTSAHDLTSPLYTTITISGANESQFNGTFTVVEFVSRLRITFTVADSGATSATGTPVLEGAESDLRSYNGPYQVKLVNSPTTFTVEHSVATLGNPVGAIVGRANPRIGGSINFESMIRAFEKQQGPVVAPWMFVALSDVYASKSRVNDTDSVANIGAGDSYSQQVIQGFEIVVVVDGSTDLTGRVSRDNAEDLFQIICQCVCGLHLDNGLATGSAQGGVSFISHAPTSDLISPYAHTYRFEQVSDMSYGDTVGHDTDVAFRDIDLTLFIDTALTVGTTSMTAGINLDDVPE